VPRKTAQFVATAAAEKLAAMNTAEFFGEPPQPDDEIV
jgi:hypothetical protein